LKGGSLRGIIHGARKNFLERSHDEIKHDSEEKSNGGFEQFLGEEGVVNGCTTNLWVNNLS